MSFTSRTATGGSTPALGSVATRERGPRARHRTGLARGALGLGGRLRRRGRVLVVLVEFVIRFAFEQGDELVGLDRLPLQQEFGDALELLGVVVQQRLRGLMGALDDAADLVVDLTRDLIGVVGLRGELATEERLAAIVAEDARA